MYCYFCGEEIKEKPDNHHPDKQNQPNVTVSSHHKCHMIHHGLYPKNYSKLRQLVDAREGYQLSRIRYQHRIKSLQKLGFELTKLDEKIFKEMIKREEQLNKEVVKIVQELPIWKEWLKDVYGIGALLSGQIIAYTDDIGNFSSFPKFKSFFGYGLYDDKIQSYEKGHNHKFSCTRKSIVFKIGRAFVSCKNRGSVYGKMYDIYRKRYSEKHLDYTLSHIHLMAMRKVGCVFLKHLWQNWRRIDNMNKDKSDCDCHAEKVGIELSSYPLPLTYKRE